jgi:Holliday junction resolvasome RuvABC endonuclease subunit
MIIIGIDPSINCTGVCIRWDESDNEYYMIPSKTTKKLLNFSHEYIHIQPYLKFDAKDKEYSEKEEVKTLNIASICQNLKDIICGVRVIDDVKVIMEGVSYGSVGSAALVDLAGLNFAIRYMLISNNIPFEIVSPTSVKKFAVANGSAEKDIIIDAWKRLDRNISDVSDIKIDDLADSYFLAHYKSS